MAKRLIVSGIDGGSTGNTGYDYLQPWSYFLNGDAVGGSGVVDVAAGHLQVTESSPAAMTVDVKKGAVILRDNNADPFLKRAYIGVLESDSDGVGLVVAPNTSGNNRIDAVVAYADLSAATAARGLDQFVVTVVTGSGATALSDAALQTAVDDLVTGYSDVPFTRLYNITVADSASSIVNANLEDTRTAAGISVMGNVGIGTASPDYSLDVVSTGASQARLRRSGTGNSALRFENDNQVWNVFLNGSESSLRVTDTTNSKDMVRLGNNGRMSLGTGTLPTTSLVNIQTVAGDIDTITLAASSNENGIRFGGSTVWGIRRNASTGLYIEADNASTRILSIRNIGAGSLTTEFSGVIRPATDNVHTCGGSGARWSAVWAANGTIQTSDIRLKENIRELEAVGEKLGLGVIRYHEKGDESKQERIGLSAQEVQKVYPEVVTTAEDGALGLNYAGLVPVLLKKIQELEARIEKLEA